ncbi:unnamed protein product, partial [Tetraodon nigroviridis]
SMVIAVCITALYSLICVVGLLGNVLVMYGVVSVYFFQTSRYTKMKTATNIYIFNLALADALATSTLPFQSAKYLMNTWSFGELLCKLVIAIDYYNMFTSIFTLTMMSVDRYVAVCHPVRALDFRTPAKAKIINVFIWILSSAVGVPVMMMAATKETDKGNIACMLRFPKPEKYWETTMKVCVFIFAFVVPVLVITICYGLMILRLKSVRLLSGSQREGQEPPADHPHGPGGGGGLHRLLDSHPHLHHRQDGGVHRPQEPAGGCQLAPVHRAGLHEQQPEPGPLRLPGRELQKVLQGLLPAPPLPPGAEQLLQSAQHHP